MQIVEPLLGTRAEVEAQAGSAERAIEAERRVLERVARLEHVFTVFEPDSELCKYQRTGHTSSPELIAVLELADHWRAQSAGAFDPSVQHLMEVWDEGERIGAVPNSEQINMAKDKRHPNVADNLNAIAKGWIAQAAIDAATTELVDSIWLSLGGDIVHRGQGSVAVGIEDPNRPYDNVAPFAHVELSNEALATSGGSRRWWTIGNQRFAKVIDPRTGHPVNHIASATVIAPDAATADVLATIALVASVEDTGALVLAANAHCLLVTRDGSRAPSSDRFVMS